MFEGRTKLAAPAQFTTLDCSVRSNTLAFSSHLCRHCWDDFSYYLGGMPVQTTQSIVSWQTQRTLELKNSPDVIVLGDSSALVGVIPPLIQKRTRLTCQNFGLVQDVTIKSHVDMLEFFLKKHRKPNQQTLRTLLRNYPHARLATPYARYLPAKYFADFHHVNHRGAILNSRTLGAILNRLLPRRR